MAAKRKKAVKKRKKSTKRRSSGGGDQAGNVHNMNQDGILAQIKPIPGMGIG